MSEQHHGAIEWHDLTVPNADEVRDFYAAVVGWKPQPVSMGDYYDWGMADPTTNEGRAGICHRRGTNADLPAQWIMYIRVADFDASVRECEARGGKVLVGPKNMGPDTRYCVIQDPAGAVCALYWSKAS